MYQIAFTDAKNRLDHSEADFIEKNGVFYEGLDVVEDSAVGGSVVEDLTVEGSVVEDSTEAHSVPDSAVDSDATVDTEGEEEEEEEEESVSSKLREQLQYAVFDHVNVRIT